MRPYLAVIRDSFREALATRVLWIVLILISLFLAIVAPFGFEKTVAISLQFTDIQDPAAFIKHLVEHKDQPDTPAGHLWNTLPEGFQKELQKLKPDGERGPRMRATGRLRNEINKQLTSREFYDEEVWKGVRLDTEAAGLREQGLDTLDDDQHARFSRLAFDAAFRNYVDSAGRDAIQFGYLWYPIGGAVPLSEEQVHQFAEAIISFLVSFLVGNIGVFIALLVTASIVPQMLDAGAIDLLLSKPVSRPLLFLSKFFGGCVFILLNAVFLIVGLWLIIGWRLNLWNSGLLWTIPVFVFVFAIYYSVSTLAAVLWRNPVVSIIVSILFWALCFTVGVAKTQLDQWFLNARRTVEIVPAGESLLITKREGNGFEWNADEKNWMEVFRNERRGPPGQPYPFIGPTFDAKNDRLLAVRSNAAFPWMRGTPKLVVAVRDKDWKPADSIDAPAGTKVLAVDGEGTILVAGTGGLFQMKGNLQAGGGGFELFGMKVPGLGPQAAFVRVDDESLDWKTPFAASIDGATGDVVVRSGDRLALLTRNDEGEVESEKYEVQQSIEWPGSDETAVGRAGSRVAVASQDGTITILDASTLKSVAEYSPFGENEPRLIRTSPDGRWIAVLFHHRRVWLYDTHADAAGSSPPDQGDISAIAFGPENSLYVSSGFGRVVKYKNAESLTETERFSHERDFLENLYQWGIDPVYAIFPKPGQMDNVVSWLMTKQQTVRTDSGQGGLNSERIVLDIWEPIWSNLAFVTVMLTVTCILISRRDF